MHQHSLHESNASSLIHWIDLNPIPGGEMQDHEKLVFDWTNLVFDWIKLSDPFSNRYLFWTVLINTHFQADGKMQDEANADRHPGLLFNFMGIQSTCLCLRVRNLKYLQGFSLNAKAGIWPWLSYMCHIRSIAECDQLWALKLLGKTFWLNPLLV